MQSSLLLCETSNLPLHALKHSSLPLLLSVMLSNNFFTKLVFVLFTVVLLHFIQHFHRSSLYILYFCSVIIVLRLTFPLTQSLYTLLLIALLRIQPALLLKRYYPLTFCPELAMFCNTICCQ